MCQGSRPVSSSGFRTRCASSSEEEPWSTSWSSEAAWPGSPPPQAQRPRARASPLSSAPTNSVSSSRDSPVPSNGSAPSECRSETSHQIRPRTAHRYRCERPRLSFLTERSVSSVSASAESDVLAAVTGGLLVTGRTGAGLRSATDVGADSEPRDAGLYGRLVLADQHVRDEWMLGAHVDGIAPVDRFELCRRRGGRLRAGNLTRQLRPPASGLGPSRRARTRGDRAVQRPRLVPDASSTPIAGSTSCHSVLIDDRSRVIDEQRRPIPGLRPWRRQRRPVRAGLRRRSRRCCRVRPACCGDRTRP